MTINAGWKAKVAGSTFSYCTEHSPSTCRFGTTSTSTVHRQCY